MIHNRGWNCKVCSTFPFKIKSTPLFSVCSNSYQNITSEFFMIQKQSYCFVDMQRYLMTNPNVGWSIVPSLFQMAISPWKRGLEVPNFLNVHDSLWTFRKSKKKWFFTVILGFLEREDTIYLGVTCKEVASAVLHCVDQWDDLSH